MILTYEVTKGELSGYQTTNDYIPGKSNPFGDVSKTITEEEPTTTDNSENNNDEGSANSNQNKETEPKVEPSNPSVYEEKSTK